MTHPAADLRLARPDDAPGLARFATQAFTDTYRGLDDDQDIADYCAEHFTPAVMAAVIADPACTTTLAWVGDALAGYAIVRDKPAPPCVTGPAVQLWRLYLDQAFIGQRLGARLMQVAQQEAHRRGAQTLWLGVYDRNVRAVDFYRRFGFVQVGTSEFLFGGRIYADPIYAAAVPKLATALRPAAGVLKADGPPPAPRCKLACARETAGRVEGDRS